MAASAARAVTGGGARSGPLKGPAREAWEALFVLNRRVSRETEARLHAAGLPPLVWYDALYTLYRSEEERLRQCTLAERIQLSPSGLSRLVDRMVARGVVERHEVAGDRRAAELSVTETGIELMRAMWAQYGAVIEEHVAPAIAGREAEVTAMLGSAAAGFEVPAEPDGA